MTHKNVESIWRQIRLI